MSEAMLHSTLVAQRAAHLAHPMSTAAQRPVANYSR